MKFCCNLSNELMELIKEKEVSIDYVKVYLTDLYDTMPEEYKTYGKLMLHGFGNGVPQHTGIRYQKDQMDWKQINHQIQDTNTPYVALHCASYWKDWENTNVTYQEVKDRMNGFLKDWKEHVNVKLLIENVPYSKYYETNSPGIIKHCVEPSMIRELCEENDIGLCLDLAHAKVTADGLHLPLKEYLEQLPLPFVKEIHVVGTRMVDEVMRDNHIEMVEEDYEILAWVLERTNVEYLTLEYGGFGEHFSWRSDKNAIKRQLERLIQIANLKRNA